MLNMWRFLCLVVSVLAELSVKNSVMKSAPFSLPKVTFQAPAIASRCKRLAQKRENGVWTTSKVSSTCSTYDDEEAVRICKEVSKAIKYFKLRVLQHN